MANALPKICVIGAGSSGLPVVKALAERGMPVTCFEKTRNIGGLWCIDNKASGSTAAYDSLHINTDTRMMEYRDFPMPDTIPAYPSHTEIHRYFCDYATRFDLYRHIRLETPVTHARRRDDGVWQITTGAGDYLEFDVLVVANGHHWDPKWPDPYPGMFSGEQIHSHSYRNPDDPISIRGKTVMVVGIGNSAVDIASELGHRSTGAHCLLSVRRGAWIMPKWVFGLPLTRPFVNTPHWVPWRLGAVILNIASRLTFGTPMSYGLPRPDHKWLRAHPTISQDLYSRLGHGDIAVKPAIQSFDGKTVCFIDGSKEQVDLIVWCTGYKVTFPFFDADFLSVKDNYLPLWQRMVLPGIENLFFVGLYQPLGSVMQPAELQAKVIADYLCGDISFPDAQTMRREMLAAQEANDRRFVKSTRHTMEVDFVPFLHALRELRKRGRKLAAGRKATQPVVARAQ
ncbi:MAG: monooxygenase [Proteobacteria bacterium]|nr:MAG: monooxygenase [Pseudomonadota bacterium]